METATLVEKVKLRLGITDTKHDEFLQEVAPDQLDYAKAYTNNPFTNDEGVEVIPGPVILFVAKACEFNMGQTGLRSRSMGEVSYSYEIDLPKGIIKLLKPYKRVKFR
ncbi:phage head-tail connector protein [Halobacillus karajensis]|uniref:Phage gp6-like head-tail connector protein n=1 Tax=Halobacillus karajensis TaxID=195088 RepID=A0A059NUX8_9BACI|nr:phage head-tail connector protein [Halobacillus karajensis]CDQ22574.1 Phage gp6-like head-tail connector protein [Halobacillus karajensis]CDQ26056.1 Phage gp6-like head-tail connector protein [Halobacillus karajensis]